MVTQRRTATRLRKRRAFTSVSRAFENTRLSRSIHPPIHPSTTTTTTTTTTTKHSRVLSVVHQDALQRAITQNTDQPFGVRPDPEIYPRARVSTSIQPPSFSSSSPARIQPIHIHSTPLYRRRRRRRHRLHRRHRVVPDDEEDHPHPSISIHPSPRRRPARHIPRKSSPSPIATAHRVGGAPSAKRTRRATSIDAYLSTFAPIRGVAHFRDVRRRRFTGGSRFDFSTDRSLDARLVSSTRGCFRMTTTSERRRRRRTENDNDPPLARPFDSQPTVRDSPLTHDSSFITRFVFSEQFFRCHRTRSRTVFITRMVIPVNK